MVDAHCTVSVRYLKRNRSGKSMSFLTLGHRAFSVGVKYIRNLETLEQNDLLHYKNEIVITVPVWLAKDRGLI